MKLVVTGGAGFIGSNLIRQILKKTDHTVINVDCLTYAGNLQNLEDVADDARYQHANINICDSAAISQLFQSELPDAVIHLAAESHVDRSIDGPDAFMKTNIMGTYELLEAFRGIWSKAKESKKSRMRFLHVSTDEVYGSLGQEGLFTEETAYQPNSPYAASKASSDHLVRAWHRTFGLPTLISNCSNNYGPFQDLEKLIPLMVTNALEEKKLPVYGKGDNVRDWLYVEDHARALIAVLEKGRIGESYNIGGHNEWQNIDVVKEICRLVDKISPSEKTADRQSLIHFVTDRPGHDERYAIDSRKIQKELGWVPEESFETGLEKTVAWYLDRDNLWCKNAKKDPSKRARAGLSGVTEVAAGLS